MHDLIVTGLTVLTIGQGVGAWFRGWVWEYRRVRQGHRWIVRKVRVRRR